MSSVCVGYHTVSLTRSCRAWEWVKKEEAGRKVSDIKRNFFGVELMATPPRLQQASEEEDTFGSSLWRRLPPPPPLTEFTPGNPGTPGLDDMPLTFSAKKKTRWANESLMQRQHEALLGNDCDRLDCSSLSTTVTCCMYTYM
jgi:hypothetical protein